MRRKQSVEKGVSYIGDRKRYRKRAKRGQRGRGLPIGLIVSAAAPFLGETAKLIFKRIFAGRRKRRRWGKTYCYDNALHHKGFNYQTVYRS